MCKEREIAAASDAHKSDKREADMSHLSCHTNPQLNAHPTFNLRIVIKNDNKMKKKCGLLAHALLVVSSLYFYDFCFFFHVVNNNVRVFTALLS